MKNMESQARPSLPERVMMALRLGPYKEVHRLNRLGGDARSPIFLMVGSLTDISYKDAVAYARGLAEEYVVSDSAAWIRVKEDRANGRYLYEIHDGGVGYSVLEKVCEKLAQGEKVHIRLANSGYVTISEEHDQVYSLIATNEHEVYPTQSGGSAPEPVSVEEYIGTARMKELYPQSRGYIAVGGAVLAVSFTIFMIVASLYAAVAFEVLDDDLLTTGQRQAASSEISGNPVFQLELAKRAADSAGRHIAALRKSGKNWSWELSQ